MHTMDFTKLIRLGVVVLLALCYSVTFPVLSSYHIHPVVENPSHSLRVTEYNQITTVVTHPIFCTACRVNTTQVVNDLFVRYHANLPYLGPLPLEGLDTYQAFCSRTYQGRAPPSIPA